MSTFNGKALSATMTCGVTSSEPGRGAGPRMEVILFQRSI